MPTERVQRQIDRLLDEAEQAMATGDWDIVRLRCDAVLSLDTENEDAHSYLAAATNKLASAVTGDPPLFLYQ